MPSTSSLTGYPGYKVSSAAGERPVAALFLADRPRGIQTRMALPSRLSHWKYGMATAVAGAPAAPASGEAR